jgi:hypothetical protein
MLNRTILALALFAACGGSKAKSTTAAASRGCPATITEAVSKAYPDAKQNECEEENEDGKHIYEVKITKADGSAAEVEVNLDGTIGALEEVVPTAALPDAVSKAFAAKYPGAVATRAERITAPGKPVVFEIKFAGKEAAFDESGGFLEEEGADKDDDGKGNDKD